MRRPAINTTVVVACVVLIAILFVANLAYGSIHIPIDAVTRILLGGEGERTSWTNIVLVTRLPQAITALFAGAALAVSGLMLQTMFQNPLAGPSLLGISAGANLGVAIVMLFLGGTMGQYGSLGIGGHLLIIVSAFVGASAILGLILVLSNYIKSNLVLLIAGIMIGYIASAAISILNFYASHENAHAFVMWGMGDFSSVSLKQIPFFVAAVSVGLLIALLLIKSLNALLLGQRYAENLGVALSKTRLFILLSAGLLIAVTTAFCGPVAFLGLAVPHIARMLLGSVDHRSLLPFTLILGALLALLCNLLTTLPSSGAILPINAITSMLGGPVMLYVILNRSKSQGLN
ncbi:iron ABC transporter permease [uncultured Acetobacteroides sp.]|uniref:iron ABC transporter permease n=1 Tax=uncultured Acetobacteroides sp. TaxID=1760811 RepID=UPI0029F4E34D|nr:iron ABC transporter permease [uncultured Acetobacteroides sp.]